jgi:hypothetical protein
MNMNITAYKLKDVRLKQKTVIFSDMIMCKISLEVGGKEFFIFASESDMRFVQCVSHSCSHRLMPPVIVGMVYSSL